MQHVLDLGRIDVLAAGDVHVLPAVDDVVEALLVDPRGVAGVQPAVGERRFVGVRPVPVARRDVRSLDPEFAEFADAGIAAVGTDDPHLGMQHRLAGGAGLARGVLLVERQHRGRGLGHAVALLQRDAALLPHLQQRHRHRRAADAADYEAAEVGGREGRMLRHELVDRGHAEELVDAARGIADQLQRGARIERAHDQHGAAGMQHRVGVAIEPAGVEQRQHGEQHRRRRDIGGAAEIDAVPERHAVGDDGALGLARGARGVHDGRDVIERDDLGPVERLCSRDRRLVGTAGAEQQRGRDVAQFCDRQRDLGQFGVVDHQHRRGVADDELQLGHGEAGVQRQEHRADPPAGELHLQRIGRVQRQHRDPVAALTLSRSRRCAASREIRASNCA